MPSNKTITTAVFYCLVALMFGVGIAALIILRLETGKAQGENMFMQQLLKEIAAERHELNRVTQAQCQKYKLTIKAIPQKPTLIGILPAQIGCTNEGIVIVYPELTAPPPPT